MNFNQNQFIQQSDDGRRSPFMPIRSKANSSMSPPNSPLPPTNRLTRPASSTSSLNQQYNNNNVQSTPSNSRILNQINNNLPSLSIQSSSPTDYRHQGGSNGVSQLGGSAIRKVITTDNSLLPPSSNAPRIRARVTVAATPRRKPPVPAHSYAVEPSQQHPKTPIASTSRNLVPSGLSSVKRPLPNLPISRNNDYDAIDSLDRGMGSLALGSNTYTIDEDNEVEDRRSKKGKDNVLVCLRYVRDVTITPLLIY